MGFQPYCLNIRWADYCDADTIKDQNGNYIEYCKPCAKKNGISNSSDFVNRELYNTYGQKIIK